MYKSLLNWTRLISVSARRLEGHPRVELPGARGIPQLVLKPRVGLLQPVEYQIKTTHPRQLLKGQTDENKILMVEYPIRHSGI